jgi:LuxR family maltose regulon positive regulatory protein
LATRTVPPLALSSLEAGVEVFEIGREDLAFDEHETAQALAFSGIFTQNAGSVFRGTEGWPVGVYLAGEGLRRSGPEALADSILGARPLERYVADEMLSELASEDRDFLVRTSILDELNSDLCDHVTGESGSEARLAEATGSNLLVSVIDENGEWVRCHPVLREALLRILRSDDHLDVIDLHRRAHGWFIDHGFVPEAIKHAVVAGDHQNAAELIVANWFEYWVTGRSQTALGWLEALPESVINEYPSLVVASAWISILLGDATAAIHHAEAALKAELDRPEPDSSLSYPSLLAILQANLWPDGVTKNRRRAEATYEMEPSDSRTRRLVAIFLGNSRVATGDFDGGRAALEEAIAAPDEPDAWTTYAAGHLALLEVLQGRWLEGAERASATIERIEALGLNNQLSSGAAYVAAAVTAAHRHQVDEAHQRLRAVTAMEQAISLGTPFDGLEIHTFAAEAELLLGNIVAARRHAQQATDFLDRVGDGGVHAARLDTVAAQIAVQPVDSQPAANEEPGPLTVRERQVLSLLQSELTLQEIGHQLYVSRNTAKTHTSRVYKKLGVSSREEALTRARELDLI